MSLIFKLLLIVTAYLLGSIPSSVWIGRSFYDVDVREHGSGNAGFTNTVRVLGWKAGLPVFLIDIIKGYIAVNLVRIGGDYIPGSIPFINFQLILGAAAVLGHIFPVYVGFKGGKGVATLLGLLLAIQPQVTLICLGIFVFIFLTTRYVSLSSMIAGISFPVLNIVVFHTTAASLVIFSMIVSILLLLTHQKNIERLLNKEESRAKIIKRRRK
ncbi:MAG: glycerol-3-phosphate 1-O-acyltransferase PlsY [Bacteroidales bacterium]|nr:glycerol-3-phosphate 1-O-acyltransferase PlsY [Bacteroidales bacterium]MBN2818314.1 glycerol-3-phosphate 1-O-acyltransferase PlsY [Bacteroidales bacterium]